MKKEPMSISKKPLPSSLKEIKFVVGVVHVIIVFGNVGML